MSAWKASSFWENEAQYVTGYLCVQIKYIIKSIDRSKADLINALQTLAKNSSGFHIHKTS